MASENQMKFVLYTGHVQLAKSLERYISNKTISIVPFTASGDENDSVNILAGDDKEESEVFEGHFGTLFPGYMINDNDSQVNSVLDSNCYHPRVFENPVFGDLSKGLKRIIKVIEDYLEFQRLVSEIFPNSANGKAGYDVRWNDYGLKPILDNKTTILLFNHQSGSKGLWEKLYKDFFKLETCKNVFFIFYFYSDKEPENMNRKTWIGTFENEDKLWGYSRFLRDFLKARGIAFEVQTDSGLKHGSTTSQTQTRLLNIRHKVTKNGCIISPSNFYKVQLCKVKGSLKNLFGDNFPVSELFSDAAPDPNPDTLLPRAYLFNKNLYADALVKERGVVLSDKMRKELASSHEVLREMDDMYRCYSSDTKSQNNELDFFSNIGNMYFWYYLRKTISSFLDAFIYYRKCKNPVFLFIDDNPDYLESQNKLAILSEWFSTDEDTAKIYVAEVRDWKEMIKQKEILGSTAGEPSILWSVFDSKQKKLSNLNDRSEKVNPKFIIVDLDYRGQLAGLDILRKLRQETSDSNIHLIVLSRYEEPQFIHTALNNGAILYITKSDFLWLIPNVYRLEQS